MWSLLLGGKKNPVKVSILLPCKSFRGVRPANHYHWLLLQERWSLLAPGTATLYGTSFPHIIIPISLHLFPAYHDMF